MNDVKIMISSSILLILFLGIIGILIVYHIVKPIKLWNRETTFNQSVFDVSVKQIAKPITRSFKIQKFPEIDLCILFPWIFYSYNHNLKVVFLLHSVIGLPVVV